MSTSELPRLNRFRVEGLFGLYTHDIPLNQLSRITAIIGPNGSGKTACLKLIYALFNKRFSQFRLFPFKRCIWVFSDHTSIIITKKHRPSQPDERPSPRRAREQLVLEHRTPTGVKSTWTPSLKEGQARPPFDIERALPFLTRVGLHTWRHDHTGYRYDLEEVLENFEHQLPKNLKEHYTTEPPKELAALLANLKCHLIETQRLLVMPTATPGGMWSPGMTRSDPDTALAVETKSEQLKERISSILTEYARLSQSLDREFPQRILSGDSMDMIAPSAIEDELAILERRRKQLEAAGILKTDFVSLASPPPNIDVSLLRVISVYISHTHQKLGVFSDLLRRIQLFEHLINKLFMDKSIKINQSDGIEIRSKLAQKVPLRSLSSGEQHQLVLIFEMVFETSPGELILIDEPELSLHISWQQAFIEDLKQIIEINSLDVVLATHSPALIGNHFDLAVPLGPGDDA